jgi:NTE family protein
MAGKKRETALVLQGGGALGAYEVGVVKRLYEEADLIPSIVSGVSIGAINAAMLATGGPDVVARLEDMWNRFSVGPFPFIPDMIQRWFPLWGNPNFFGPHLDYSREIAWTSCYSTDPLKRILNECIDFRRINDASWTDRPRLIMTATDLQTGQIHAFDNFERTITSDHVMASSSLPPAFPMTRVDGRYYWDGGIFNNNPLSEAVRCLKGNEEVDERVIIFVELMPGSGVIPRNLLDVCDRMVDIIFSCSVAADSETLEKINSIVDVIRAVDRDLPSDSPVRDMSEYGHLLKYKKIDRLVRIVNDESESIVGPLDFSKDTITRRIAAGYRAADRALRFPPETGTR